MKKKMITSVAAIVLLCISFSAFSQDNDDNTKLVQHIPPAWVSDKGYWVAENNIHQPLQHTVRFYNNDNILTSSMTIAGKMNLNKRKTKMQLKEMLESSVHDWTVQHPGNINQDLATKP